MTADAAVQQPRKPPALLRARIFKPYRRWRRSRLYARTRAVESWLDQGRFDRAERLIQRVTAVDPSITQTIRTVLDAMPAADGLLPFAYDAAKDVQVVPRDGADAVILLFRDGALRLGLAVPAHYRWFGRLPAHLICLCDHSANFYLGGIPSLGADRDRTLSALRRIIEDLGCKRVFCYSNSGGVFGALDYGLELNAEAVLVMGGPTNLTEEFNSHLRYAHFASQARQATPNARLELRSAYAAAKHPPRVLFVYAGANWDDRIHAEDMEGLPSVTSFPIEGSSNHNVVVDAIVRGRYQAMLDWLFDPSALSKAV